jgi:hypothetical protein
VLLSGRFVLLASRVISSNASVTLWHVKEKPQMGPEERLFRSRQTWTVYAFLALTAVGVVLALITIFR